MCFSGRLRDKNENDGQLFRGMDSREKTVVSRFYGAHRKASLAPFALRSTHPTRADLDRDAGHGRHAGLRRAPDGGYNRAMMARMT